jgi:hypothetical protein
MQQKIARQGLFANQLSSVEYMRIYTIAALPQGSIPNRSEIAIAFFAE